MQRDRTMKYLKEEQNKRIKSDSDKINYSQNRVNTEPFMPFLNERNDLG